MPMIINLQTVHLLLMLIFLITNDKHFDVLKEISFPKIRTVRLEEFEPFLKKEIQ